MERLIGPARVLPLAAMTEHDARGLIREAYRMEIGEPECRSIFLDWALTDAGPDQHAAIRAMLERHGAPDHPMTGVLRDGLAAPQRTGRRGGWRARRGG